MPKFNIAIDGPSGVGKSAYYLLKNKVDVNNEKELLDALENIDISFQEDQVFLNGENVSKEIRTNEISMAASKFSAFNAVRKKLVSLQQQIAKNKGYILDGRDICSVVLPDAEVKIYMDASSKARAQRRYQEYISKGIDADYETIFQDIVARDYQDSHRKISPLQVAEDAQVIDTSDMTIEEVVEEIQKIIDEKV